MACPYFEPAEMLAEKAGVPMPLGDLWAGWCRAETERGWLADHDTLRRFCNLGYARLGCRRFPQNGGPDAVRFSIAAEGDGLVRLRCCVERDHHPFQHGELEYSASTHAFLDAGTFDETVRRQARAYLAGYFRRTGRASGS
jgi:hypothetical protein